MHYLDPERPTQSMSGGLPLLQGVSKRIVLPCLHVSPRGTPDAIQMEISIFLPMPSGGASRKEITIDPADFPAFWSEWLADPEGTAHKRFGWRATAPDLDFDLDDLFGGFV